MIFWQAVGSAHRLLQIYNTPVLKPFKETYPRLRRGIQNAVYQFISLSIGDVRLCLCIEKLCFTVFFPGSRLCYLGYKSMNIAGASTPVY